MLSELVKNGTHQQLQAALEERQYDHDELTAALLAAIRRNAPQMVELLLNHHANPNNAIPDDWFALHIAVEFEQLDIVKLLVERGADVNLRDQSGSTPLHVAVDLEGDSARQRGVLPVAGVGKLLLELGADPLIKNEAGRTPMDIARDYDHEEAVTMIEQKLTEKGGA